MKFFQDAKSNHFSDNPSTCSTYWKIIWPEVEIGRLIIGSHRDNYYYNYPILLFGEFNWFNKTSMVWKILNCFLWTRTSKFLPKDTSEFLFKVKNKFFQLRCCSPSIHPSEWTGIDFSCNSGRWLNRIIRSPCRHQIPLRALPSSPLSSLLQGQQQHHYHRQQVQRLQQPRKLLKDNFKQMIVRPQVMQKIWNWKFHDNFSMNFQKPISGFTPK